MEDIVKECSCTGVCHGKNKYPGPYIQEDCLNFEDYIKNIKLMLKQRSDLKSKPQDDPEVQSELSTNAGCITAYFKLTYKCDLRLKKCAYVNQFVKNTDYGKKYMDFKVKNSEIVEKILSMDYENTFTMDKILENPYYIDTYLQ